MNRKEEFNQQTRNSLQIEKKKKELATLNFENLCWIRCSIHGYRI